MPEKFTLAAFWVLRAGSVPPLDYLIHILLRLNASRAQNGFTASPGIRYGQRPPYTNVS
jgi:hypothetical protein